MDIFAKPNTPAPDPQPPQSSSTPPGADRPNTPAPVPAAGAQSPAPAPAAPGAFSSSQPMEAPAEPTVQAVLDSANERYNEALALAHGGKQEEAVAQLQAAISLAGNQANYYNLLGTCYAQLGRYSEAVETWRKTLTLDDELDRAYRNIEKARRLEDEAVYQKRRRPFDMALVVAIVATLFFGAATFGLGYKAWNMSGSIASLESQRDGFKDDVAEQQRKLEGTVPQALYEQLDTRTQQLKGQLDEKIAIIQRKDVEHTQMLEQRLRQITELERRIQIRDEELATLNANLAQIVPLTAENANLTGQIEALNAQLAQKNETLSDLNKARDELYSQSNTLQTVIEAGRQRLTEVQLQAQKDMAVAIVAKNKEIDALSQNVSALRNNIAKTDLATQAAQQALQELNARRFDEALNYVKTALGHDPKHTIALALDTRIKQILSDPFQKALMVEGAKQLAERNAEKRREMVLSLSSRGEKAMKDGLYFSSADYYRQALELVPEGDDDRGKIAANRQKAEESARRIRLQLDEAQRESEGGDPERARQIIKTILKESPRNAEAKSLRDTLDEKTNS